MLGACRSRAPSDGVPPPVTGDREIRYSALVLTSPRALGLILLAAPTGACLTQNPGFDPGAGATSTGTPATTSTGLSTEPTSTTGSPDPSTSGASGDLSTGAGTTVLVEPGTTTADSTTGDVPTGTTQDATTGDACVGIPGDLCEPLEIVGAPYLLCELGGPWAQAVATCEAHCMRLVILDEAESVAIQAVLAERMTEEDKAEAATIPPLQQLSAPRASWWIGGYKDGPWLWLDGTNMPPYGQGGWAVDNPDIDGTNACAAVAVYGKGDGDGKWFDRPCDDVPYRFICEPA